MHADKRQRIQGFNFWRFFFFNKKFKYTHESIRNCDLSIDRSVYRLFCWSHAQRTVDRLGWDSCFYMFFFFSKSQWKIYYHLHFVSLSYRLQLKWFWKKFPLDKVTTLNFSTIRARYCFEHATISMHNSNSVCPLCPVPCWNANHQPRIKCEVFQ